MREGGGENVPGIRRAREICASPNWLSPPRPMRGHRLFFVHAIRVPQNSLGFSVGFSPLSNGRAVAHFCKSCPISVFGQGKDLPPAIFLLGPNVPQISNSLHPILISTIPSLSSAISVWEKCA